MSRAKAVLNVLKIVSLERLLAALIFICVTSVGVSSKTAEFVFDFDISPKPLSETLIEFGRITGLQFFFEKEMMAGLESQGLTGKFIATEAIRRLLDGTDIIFKVRAGRVLVFEKQEKEKDEIRQSASPSIEEIKIVGTRARGLGFGGIVPVTVITTEDLEFAGSIDSSKIFLDLPQSNNVVTTANSNNLVLGTGLELIDLRNLGPNRTLILVNGHRFAATGSIPPFISTTEIGSIPLDFVERIEILTGSASTLYGSNAIAGVINFTLKKNFEGITASLLAGTSQRSDAESFRFSTSLGAPLFQGRAHLSGHFSYSKEGEILQGSRPNLSEPSAFIDGMLVKGAGGSPVTGSGLVVGLGDSAGTFFPFGVNSPNPPLFIGLDGEAVEEFTGSPGQLFNFTESQFLLTPKTQFLFNLNGALDLGGELETFLEIFVGTSTTQNQFAPTPLSSEVDQAIRVPFTNPFIPVALSALIDQAANAGFTSLFLDRRILEAGVQRGEVNKNFQNILWGVKGPLRQWGDFDVSYHFSSVKTRDHDFGAIDLSRVQAAADPMLCQALESAGCSLTDFFGDNSITQTQLDFITVPGIITQREKSTRQMISASLKGNLIELPSGFMNGTFGLEFRKENYSLSPSQLTQDGNQAGSLGLGETKGEIKALEAYVDVVTPIFKNRKKIRSLSLETAIRFSNFSTVGTIFNGKVGFEFIPFSGFRVRTMYQRGVREPNIQEFFSSNRNTALNFLDFCTNLQQETRQTVINNCTSSSPLGNIPDGFQDSRLSLAGRVSGNSHLRPEKSHSLTFGFIYSPSGKQFLGSGNFFLSMDFYAIGIKSPIFLPTFPQVLEACFESPNFSSDFCGTNPANGQPFFERNPVTHEIINPNLSVRNGERLTVMGIDAEISYSWFLKKGMFTPSDAEINLEVRHTFNFFNETSLIPGVENRKTSGELFRPLYRSIIKAAYRTRSLDLQWRIRHQGKGVVTFSAPLSAGNVSPSFVYHDVSLRFKVQNLASFIFGIDNLMDNQPPFLAFGVNGTDTFPQLYDVAGRRFWLKLIFSY